MGAAVKAEGPSSGGIRGCSGKDAFESISEANKAVVRKGERSNKQKSNFPYACGYCGKYHLGRNR